MKIYDFSYQFISTKSNQEIYTEFAKQAITQIDSGSYRIGAKAIMENLRSQKNIPYSGMYKISNSFIAYYPRIFILFYPQHKARF